MDGRFAAFVLVSTLLIVTPGPDMALVTRNAIRSGRRAAALTAYGVAAGIAVWGLASVLGLAVLLEKSALAFTILKLAGAVYLCILGGIALTRSENRSPVTAGTDAAVAVMPVRTAFAQGLAGNLLNPKAGIIFVTVVPQFIRQGDPPLRLLLMLAVFEAVLISWLSVYGSLVARAATGRAGLRARAVINRLTGLVLIGLGMRLAAERG